MERLLDDPEGSREALNRFFIELSDDNLQSMFRHSKVMSGDVFLEIVHKPEKVRESLERYYGQLDSGQTLRLLKDGSNLGVCAFGILTMVSDQPKLDEGLKNVCGADSQELVVRLCTGGKGSVSGSTSCNLKACVLKDVMRKPRKVINALTALGCRSTHDRC